MGAAVGGATWRGSWAQTSNRCTVDACNAFHERGGGRGAGGLRQGSVGARRVVWRAAAPHLLGVLDERAATVELPLTPRRDDLDVGLERVVGHLEAHLHVQCVCGGERGMGGHAV
eukprot:362462-Chlamydomonas_euryale.AAC.3